MPNLKNQHFLPKFYLRNFGFKSSNAEKPNLISVFTKNKQFYFPTAPLKDQGSRNYYYDKTGEVENVLGRLDNICASSIHTLLNDYIDTLNDVDISIIRTFIALTMYRNPVQLNMMIEDQKLFYQDLYNEGEINIPNGEPFTLSKAELIQMLLGFVNQAFDSTADLKLKLLINKTDIPFITSDYPIVVYNQVAECKNWVLSGHGTGCRAVQFFIPISPTKMILLFDEWGYKVGNKNSELVTIHSRDDIHQLNLLQFVNSDNLIFANENIKKFLLKQYFTTHLKYPKANVATHKTIKSSNSNRELIIKTSKPCLINLQLSFITLRTNAKQLKILNGADNARPAVLNIVQSNPMLRFPQSYKL